MAAVAAAYSIQLEGRELALLCQRVENAVVGESAPCMHEVLWFCRAWPGDAASLAVRARTWHQVRLQQYSNRAAKLANRFAGAPCGVMDQMTAALGEAGRLLALRCQPAEVQGCAPIPPHLQFWGVDSGKGQGGMVWFGGKARLAGGSCSARCSAWQPRCAWPLRWGWHWLRKCCVALAAGKAHCVSGSDYAHVRVGAFMGLRICSELAVERAAGSSSGSGSGEPAAGSADIVQVIGASLLRPAFAAMVA